MKTKQEYIKKELAEKKEYQIIKLKGSLYNFKVNERSYRTMNEWATIKYYMSEKAAQKWVSDLEAKTRIFSLNKPDIIL